MSTPERPRVLCVDDERRVVEGLALHLRKDYDVHVACSGEQALQKLGETKGAAVVVSDMRMPGMDGATLLHEVMRRYPDATRILLTGDAGRDSAVTAVNKGQIFRFLTKPCPAEQLKAAVEAGVMQYRLINAEREVMQETLVGCIRALIDVLAIANPVAFGRANRVKRLAMEFAAELDCAQFWQLEAAAMLSQIGYLSLPMELVDKIYHGEQLTPAESTLAGGVPRVAIALLEHIPRLEPVMQILDALTWSDAQIARLGDGTIGRGTRILGLALEYDSLIAQGRTVDVAVQSLHARADRFHAELIEQFAAHVGGRAAEATVIELSLRQLLVGMTILQEVRTHTGTLLVPQGFEVTATFLERLPHFGSELLSERVRVLAPVARPAGHRKT
jgi:CheY-like chemotaxis protein